MNLFLAFINFVILDSRKYFIQKNEKFNKNDNLVYGYFRFTSLWNFPENSYIETLGVGDPFLLLCWTFYVTSVCI